MTKIPEDSGARGHYMDGYNAAIDKNNKVEDPNTLSNQFTQLRMQYTQNMSELKAELEIMKKRGARTEKLMKEIYAFLLPDKPTDAMTLHQLKDGYKSRGWKILNLTKEVKDLKSRKSVIWM